MEAADDSRGGKITCVRWALTGVGWLRADTPAAAPHPAAGHARVDLSPERTQLGQVRAVVLEIETDDGAALLEEFGPPPREDVTDDVVREATASACRVVGPRAANPAGWDRLRDLRIRAFARHTH
jgi:hypothetical protein